MAAEGWDNLIAFAEGKTGSYPVTFYPVALIYDCTDGRDLRRLLIRTVKVSGDNPLTQAEAVARGRTMVEADTPDLRDGWTFGMATAGFVVLKSGA